MTFQINIWEILDSIHLLSHLLENDRYSITAARILKKFLKYPDASVRYAVLEVIACSLGEVKIADLLLEEAKEILKTEDTGFVSDYLQSLSGGDRT